MHTYTYKVHVEGQAACRGLERSGPKPGTWYNACLRN